MTVLVVTNEQDVGADYVMLELERRGIPTLRCNAERLPLWRVTLRPGQEWQLRDPLGRTASSGSVTGVWWRRPERPLFAGDLSTEEERTLVDQWQVFAEGLASVPGPMWVSPPAAIAAAENKARQLSTARRIGFSVPATVWTNNLTQAQAIIEAGETVVKTVTAAHWEGDGEAAFVFAQRLESHDLPADSSEFAAAPVALQAQIAPKRDVRVTVVGDAAFAAEVTAQRSVDWRLEGGLEWHPHVLPPAVAGQCIKLVQALNLRFGGIDLAVDQTGTYWFLEINPNGEWGWLQARGLPIASALADLLTGPSDKPDRSRVSHLAWRIGEQVLPLPVALLTNRGYLNWSDPAHDTLPAGDWATAEAGALLERSEDRLQSLESKGAGLATVCGIVAAAIAVAISLNWSGTTIVAKIILVLAAAYSFMSLYTPVVLVGPVGRATVTAATLNRAAKHEQPTAFLAEEKAEAASYNDRATQRLSNLQAASRNDARNAIIVFAVWAILALGGLVKA